MKKVTVESLVNNTEYQFRVLASNAEGSSGPSNTVLSTPEVGSEIPVTWIDLVGVSATGNSLTKTAPTGWGNGGAASAQSFSGDGKVEFTATQTNFTRMCGLSNENIDANFNTINYAIDLYSGLVYVFENGVSRGSFGAYLVGDKFSVERQGSTILYKKNGATFYTSTITSVGTLLVDVAIFTIGGKVDDVVITGVNPGPPEAITDLSANPGDTQVELEWSVPANGGSAITGYSVQYGTVESGLFDMTLSVPA